MENSSLNNRDSLIKCKTYLFVVDNTNRYKDYIVDIITNKSHFGKNNEYIIKIGGINE